MVDRATPDVTVTATPPDEASAAGRSCDIVTELVAAQLQTAADVAWLRYDVARLAGAAPAPAVEGALEATARDASLRALRSAGFDPSPFRRDLERALCVRAAQDRAAAHSQRNGICSNPP